MNAKRRKHNDIRCVRGFTLIELLVVIAIIALLISILVPGLRRAKEQAIAVVCSSQHKDIGLALNLYAQDWSGKLPRGWWSQRPGSKYTRLPVKLAPYYDRQGQSEWNFELYSCPAQPKYLTDVLGNQVVRGEAAVGSYGYNEFFFYGLNPGGRYPSNNAANWVERKITDIRTPSELPLLGCVSGEKYDILGGGGGQRLSYEGPHPKALKYGFMGGEINRLITKYTDPTGPAANHNRNCNMLMADISVQPRDVTVDGEFPWTDYDGTCFHPSRASSKGNETR